MSLADAFIQEFTHESTGTRKLIERMPEDKLGWKPHEKSMTMGRLANHLAEIPEWAKTIVEADSFDMGAGDFKPKPTPSLSEILGALQKNVDGFSDALKGVSDEHLFQNWTLEEGEKQLVKMPRLVCIRSFVLSHSIHHRGQLSVYLRLNDIPVPAIYGPSADEAM